MREIRNSRKLIYCCCIAFYICLTACTDNDKEIRQHIAGIAQTDLNFAGLSYTVANGVVTIHGKCPSNYALGDVQHTLKNIHLIKAIDSDIIIAPVLLDENTPVRQKVDSVLSVYPQVTASIDSSALRLAGKVSRADELKLLPALHKVCSLTIVNQITTY